MAAAAEQSARTEDGHGRRGGNRDDVELADGEVLRARVDVEGDPLDPRENRLRTSMKMVLKPRAASSRVAGSVVARVKEPSGPETRLTVT